MRFFDSRSTLTVAQDADDQNIATFLCKTDQAQVPGMNDVESSIDEDQPLVTLSQGFEFLKFSDQIFSRFEFTRKNYLIAFLEFES